MGSLFRLPTRNGTESLWRQAFRTRMIYPRPSREVQCAALFLESLWKHRDASCNSSANQKVFGLTFSCIQLRALPIRRCGASSYSNRGMRHTASLSLFFRRLDSDFEHMSLFCTRIIHCRCLIIFDPFAPILLPHRSEEQCLYDLVVHVLQ